MSKDNYVKWIDVAACPILQPGSEKCGHFVVPNGINKDNFIALEFDNYKQRINFIHKYNINTNNWTKMDISDNSIWKTVAYNSYHSALNAKQNVLYFLDAYGNYLIEMELNSKKVTKHLLSHENTHNSNAQCIILNNELFVIGGAECYSISKWNAESKQLTSINTIYNKTMLDVFGLTCCNDTNCILIFGGFDNNNTDDYVDYILEYDVRKNELNKLEIALPIPMCSPCCLKAINDKYVVIFGGYNMDICGGACDDIYIYSIKTQIITKSKIKCPSKREFWGVIVNDKPKDEKTVFGFVRNTWKICEIDNHYFPPFYLLKLIHSYYLSEWVYLLDTKTGKHYKMNTLDIV